MSSNVPTTNNPPPSQASYLDQWRSGRARFGWRQFRRGRDKKWYFPGQKPDETVRMVVRKHKIFLLRPALPLIGAIIAFILVTDVAFTHPNPAWGVLEAVIIVLIVIAIGWFLWKDFVVWWFESYIITDKRIISSRGLLQPTKQETPIEKVQQVGIDIDNPLGFLLSFGTVHVYLVGGDLKLVNVPHPRRVRDAIVGSQEAFKASKPPEEKLIPPSDPVMASLIDELAKPQGPKKPPDADEHYLPPRNPDRYRGPRRTFGGILRIPCDVRYTSGEYTVLYIQRSRFILYRNLVPCVLALLVVLPIAFYFGPVQPVWWFIMGLAILVLLLITGLVYTNWADDVFILTNKRIIDINRRLIFFYETREEAEYKMFRDVKVIVPNVLMRILDIGNIYIETPGTNPDIHLMSVDHPFFLMDNINEVRTYKEKADAAEAVNKQKEEMKKWFSKVINRLEQMKGAPNLERLDLLDAIELANQCGLQIAVEEEDPNSHLPSGMVLYQTPSPGTSMRPGEVIQVVVSGAPAWI